MMPGRSYVTLVTRDVLADPTIPSYIGSDWVAVWGTAVCSSSFTLTNKYRVARGGGFFPAKGVPVSFPAPSVSPVAGETANLDVTLNLALP
jgi:hypothetical protein